MEYVVVGRSIAPAEGDHEPPAQVGALGGTQGHARSQTAAASDIGRTIRLSNGEVPIPTGEPAALPSEFRVASMRQSGPPSEWYLRSTIYVGLRDPDTLLSRRGDPRTADPGPESQPSGFNRVPKGLPTGQRRPRIVPPAQAGEGFEGATVTQKIARTVLGTRRQPKARPFAKLPRQPFNPRLMFNRRPRG